MPKFDALDREEAELEQLERSPRPPVKKKAAKTASGKPRDELGRFDRAKEKRN